MGPGEAPWETPRVARALAEVLPRDVRLARLRPERRQLSRSVTGASLVVGGVVILLDPIFQGLAVALISGVVVSTVLSLLVIPVLYYMYVKTVGKEAVVRG